MKFKDLEKLSEQQFRRQLGVKRETFAKMVEVIQKAYDQAKATAKSKAGRRSKLDINQRVLIALEYWREYRTYASIGLSYGIGEGRAFEYIRWTENALIKSREFSLPGKKALLKTIKQDESLPIDENQNESNTPKDASEAKKKDGNELDLILIDVTESSIERPKKNSENFIQAKRSGTLSKLS